MSVRIVRLPDVGEGVAEAELVAWHVAVGDAVTSDTVVAEVLTDKATVEIYAPVAGTVTVLHGTPGDVLAVGSDFIGIDTGGSGADAPAPADQQLTTEPAALPDEVPATSSAAPPATVDQVSSTATPVPRASGERVLAAPAVRERALELGIEIADVQGTGPGGRVTHADLDRHLAGSGGTPTGRREPPSTASTQVPVTGLRRKIAAQVASSASRIPHITYVDEVDMTQLEQLRRTLASTYPEQPRLTVLPFVMHAIVLAVADQPHLNATYDDEAQVLTTHGAVHVGIATQTPNGLIVPVVRDVQALDLWSTATELARVTSAARDGSAQRAELSGSTITVTSLGALGGLVTTPIINHPEVAIVGINKMQTRPVWDGATFVPRTMMNLSSSFDHRIVDGWDAAIFVQRVKALLEEPALLFVPSP